MLLQLLLESISRLDIGLHASNVFTYICNVSSKVLTVIHQILYLLLTPVPGHSKCRARSLALLLLAWLKRGFGLLCEESINLRNGVFVLLSHHFADLPKPLIEFFPLQLVYYFSSCDCSQPSILFEFLQLSILVLAHDLKHESFFVEFLLFDVHVTARLEKSILRLFA